MHSACIRGLPQAVAWVTALKQARVKLGNHTDANTPMEPDLLLQCGLRSDSLVAGRAKSGISFIIMHVPLQCWLLCSSHLKSAPCSPKSCWSGYTAVANGLQTHQPSHERQLLCIGQCHRTTHVQIHHAKDPHATKPPPKLQSRTPDHHTLNVAPCSFSISWP